MARRRGGLAVLLVVVGLLLWMGGAMLIMRATPRIRAYAGPGAVSGSVSPGVALGGGIGGVIVGSSLALAGYMLGMRDWKRSDHE